MDYEPLPQRPTSPVHDLDTADEDSQHPEDVQFVKPSILSARITWINFVLGAAVLLPWNALITAMPYFLSQLSGSSLQRTFSSYLSATFTLTGFCFLAHATATSEQSNFPRLIRRSLFMLTLLLLFLAGTTLWTLPAKFFFFFVIANGVCQSAAGAYLQAGVIAVASLFGPLAIQSALWGQAAVGILVSVVQLLTSIAGIQVGKKSGGIGNDDAAKRAAFLFFGFSSLFMVFTIVSHTWLVSLPAYKAVVVPFEAKRRTITQDEQQPLGNVPRLQVRSFSSKVRIIEIAKLNGSYNFAAAWVFVITLSVFPPITSSIQSVNPTSPSLFTNPLVFTAIHFLLFNVGDFLGRALPMVDKFQIWSGKHLVVMSISRTLFIPLFLLCNFQRPSSSPSSTPVGPAPLINSDVLFFLIVLFFGITNGWIASLALMAASSVEYNPLLRARPEDVDIAATVAQFFMVGGLVFGSFMSFGVKGAICSCNPFTT